MTKSEPTGKEAKGSLTQLERAFDAIDALINASQPLKLTALSEVTRLDASGTLRLLKTLADLGYVIRDDARKSYLPGARALFPLSLYHPIQELRRDSTDLLVEIQRTTAATSALQIFLGGQRVVIEQRHGSSRLTPFWNTTVTSAYHSSSSGKLYLSTLTPNERSKLVGAGPFERFTPTTLTTANQLEADIRTSLERGFFAAREEAFSGMSSVAAPLRVPNGGVVGCMVATGTSGQLQGNKLQECGLVVRRAADMLSTMSPAVRALESLLGGSTRAQPTAAPADLERVDPAPAVPLSRRKTASRKAVG